MVWFLITCNDISMIADIHNYTTRRSGNMNLYVPKCNKELYKRRFAYQGSTLWTEPRHIISMGSPTGSPRCMMSSNGNIFRVTGHLCGNSPVTGEFPTQRPVTRSLDVFFDLHLNKRLGKQSWDWWFETPSRPLWRQCNGGQRLQHQLACEKLYCICGRIYL